MKIISEEDGIRCWQEYDFVMGSEEDRVRASEILVGMGYMVGCGVEGDFRVTVNTAWCDSAGFGAEHVGRIRDAIEAG